MMMMMAILDRAICLEEVAISVTRNVNGDCGSEREIMVNIGGGGGG